VELRPLNPPADPAEKPDMAILVAVGFGVFFLVSLAIGLRLLALSSRTGRLPERLIGIGILGIGPAGMGCMLVSAALRSAAPPLSQGVAALALVAIAAGSVAACVFNWKVFRPDSAAARAWVFATALLYGLAFGLELGTTGFADPLRPGLGGRAVSALCTVNLLWGAWESLLYYALMRRRLRIGLADPLVANRFLVWGLGIGSAGVGSLLSVGIQQATGLSMSELPGLTLSNSLFGLASAVLMWLAFVPPASWKRYIQSQA
jgi:hypothetical protein